MVLLVKKTKMTLLRNWHLFSPSNFPLLIGGDFNLFTFYFEKKNKELKSNGHNDIIKYVLNLYELKEIVMAGECSPDQTINWIKTMEKLDRELVSRG